VQQREKQQSRALPARQGRVFLSPKYKACDEMMQQQLDESERVTTMSMDLCIYIDDDAHSQ
jgi:hypothetical protein